MIIKTLENKLIISNTVVEFEQNIYQFLELTNYIVVLLMDDKLNSNNIYGVSYTGKKLWNISEIIQSKGNEAYVSIGKKDDTIFSIISFNGVKFYIDTNNNQIIDRQITK